MNKLHRQELNIQLETDFGTLHETSLSIVSTSDKALMGTMDQAHLIVGIKRLFDNNGIKLVSVALKERIVTDLILP